MKLALTKTNLAVLITALLAAAVRFPARGSVRAPIAVTGVFIAPKVTEQPWQRDEVASSGSHQVAFAGSTPAPAPNFPCQTESRRFASEADRRFDGGDDSGVWWKHTQRVALAAGEVLGPISQADDSKRMEVSNPSTPTNLRPIQAARKEPLPAASRGAATAKTTWYEAAAIDSTALLNAIADVESGSNDKAIGRRGEVSRYQFMPATWKQYTTKTNWDNSQASREVAKRHLSWLKSAYRQQTTREATAFDLAAMWQLGLRGYLRTKQLSPQSIDRAKRIVNLTK